MFPTTLKTERLLLRPPRIEDAAALFDRYGHDPKATHFLSWKTHATVEDTREFLQSIIDPPPRARDQHWVICLKPDATPCGMITTFGRGHVIGLGYVLQKSLWGRGLVSEALATVAVAVWQEPKTWRLQAYAHVDNVGSHRVLEKNGLRHEGTARRLFFMPQVSDEPQDCVLYAQTRDDVGSADHSGR